MKNLTTGILAHVDAGKTTCIESMLFLSHMIRKQGRVDHQDAFLDFDDQERKRGITIYSKEAILNWKDTRINLIDTPGHVDFSAEMERSLSVLDLAVVLISAQDGVQAHTRTIWECLNHYEIPSVLFVNKMDICYKDRQEILGQLQKELDGSVIDFESGKEELMEQLAMVNDEMLEEYTLNQTVSDQSIRKAIQNRQLHPVLFGSALKNQGIKPLLDLLDSLSEEKIWPEEFKARVYKISEDDQHNRLTHIKLLGGKLQARQAIDGFGKADQIRLYSGTGYELVQEVSAGMTAAIKGLENTEPGMGLGDLEDIQNPVLEASLSYELLLPSGSDRSLVMASLRLMASEDPALKVESDEDTGQIYVRFMGEVQMEIFQKKLFEKTGITPGFGNGRIIYRETIRETEFGYGHFEPLRHYAEVHVRIDPLKRNSGLVFSMNIPRDMLALHWQRSIINSLQEREHKGVLTRSALTDVRISLIAARAHQKHTETSDFAQAGRRAIRQALMKADSILLEPYSRFTIQSESSVLSKVLYELEQRKCTFIPEQKDENTMEITGRGPLRLLLNFQKDLSALSSGKAQIRMESDGYDECADAQMIIEETGYDPDLDKANPSASVFCSHGSGTTIPWDEAESMMHIPIESMPSESSWSMNSGKVSEQEMKAVFEKAGGSNRNQKKAAEAAFKEKKQKSRKKTELSSDPVSVKNRADLPVLLIVDGYNMIYAWKDLADIAKTSLSGARQELISRLENYMGYRYGKEGTLMVVFDGYRRSDNPGSKEARGNTRIIYTPTGQSADSLIEKKVHDLRKSFRILAATSDSLIQNSVFASGASRISARELERRIEQSDLQVSQMLKTSF